MCLRQPRAEWRLCSHENDAQAVVSFAADGLERGRLNARLCRGHLQEAPHPLNVRVARGGVGDRSFSDDVVNDDERADARELQPKANYELRVMPFSEAPAPCKQWTPRANSVLRKARNRR